jgi:hypothetical protein
MKIITQIVKRGQNRPFGAYGKAGLKSEVIVKLHLLRQTGPG